MNHILRYTVLIVSCLTLGLLLGFNLDSGLSLQSRMEIGKGAKKFEEALMFIEKNYVDVPNHSELIDNAIMGMLEHLDPHSYYISAEDMKVTEEEMSGSFEGIGVEFNIIEDTLFVVAPLAGGPSENAGVLAGDKIIKVNGENIAGVKMQNSDIVKKIKGEKGSTVKISVKRAGIAQLMEFSIIRDKIPIFSVNHSYMIEPTVGYIQLTRFAETTYDEFMEHLNRLKSQGMETLILDLRGNPGGFLQMAHKIADEFLPGGKLVVSTQGRVSESAHKYIATDKNAAFEKGGLIILTDYGSASASEILAGAVQDHDRGLIVGVRSFGKGLVQIQREFSDASAMRLTIARYYTPSGRCIQKPYDKKNHAEYESEIDERIRKGELKDPSKVNFPDSLKFKTDAGRTVYGGGGILPDYFVPEDTTGINKYFYDLSAADVFRRFAFDYAGSHPQILQQYPKAADFVAKYTISEAMMQEFKTYSLAKGVKMDEKMYAESKSLIENRLKAYIGKRLFNDDGFFPVLNQEDNVIQRALELVSDAKNLVK